MKRLTGRILLWTAATGTLTSAIFCGLAVTAALRFQRKRRKCEVQAAIFTPPVSVLKPLHGADPELAANLETFFTQDYPASFELLFCARHADDAGLQVARSVAARYPDRPVRFIACGEPKYPNPKMYSLAVMAQAAQYDVLVPSDADCRVSPSYLLRSVQSLAPACEAPAALSFALYRGAVDRGGLFTHLDAAGKSVEMASGVLVADMLSGTDFALGVSMVLRRGSFDQAGGCEDLGGYWAEDYILGNRLAAAGERVDIGTEVVEMVLTDRGAPRSLQDQLRWMQSTRRSRPWGHVGTGLTFAMPFGLLGFAVSVARGQWRVAVAFLGLALLNRWVQAYVLLQALGEQCQLVRYTLLYPLRDLLGFGVWLCSYLPADTRYHGTRFRIMPDGRLLEAQQVKTALQG